MRSSVGICGAVLSLSILAGCGPKEDTSLMPMSAGKVWTYKYRLHGIDSVGSLKVERSLSIEGRQGFELSSPEGMSRLVWKDRMLLMANGTQGRLQRPLPILILDKQEDVWHGSLETIGKRVPASAKITRLKDGRKDTFRMDYRGRKIEAIVSQVEIEIPRRSVVLTTWFAPGIGIVKQVQRTNEQQDIMIELLREN